MGSIPDIVAQARLMMRDQPRAALMLLTERLDGEDTSSDAYSILLLQAALAAQEPGPALAHLDRVCEKRSPSPRVRQVYAEALVAVGRFADAGEQLRLALQAGFPAERLSLQLKVVLQDHLMLHPGDSAHAVAPHIAAEFGVLDEHNRVMYVYCPKVACTILKATVIMNSPKRQSYLASGKNIHEFVGQERNDLKLMEAFNAPDMFRFIVLRDPASRVLSAYLNKFVPNPPNEPQGLARNKQHAIREGQRLAGVGPDPARGITFQEFVHFLAQAKDLELDPHWMPQVRIVGTDLGRYSHVGRFEALSDTFALLEQRFGYVTEHDSSVHLDGQKDHATKYSVERTMKHPYQALPDSLRRLGSVYPPADAFLPPPLRDILLKRFSRDAALHSGHGRPREGD